MEWPNVPVNDALDNFDLMALSQFKTCRQSLAAGSGSPLSARCNYGVAVLPSLFGATLYRMDPKLNTLPSCLPLEGGMEAIKALVKKGVPDLMGGYGGQVFEMAERFMEIGSRYPKIGKYVHIFHPDAQGPMDICELLWGSSIFLDIMDEPDLVHDFLTLVTETYIRFMERWFSIVPAREGVNAHWNLMHRGKIMLRDDSAMNFSPAIFEEFIRPYDQKLLKIFGGGAIHFCGRGDHYIEIASKMEGLYAINMSQPEYNNMEIIYQHTVDRNIKLVGFNAAVAREALARGRSLHSCAQA
ncbi:MAG TPA: hypothetical protein DD727_05310 [Clostridiales bacterium]|nr:hypothetical protein [Clostridiales bacterium]